MLIRRVLPLIAIAVCIPVIAHAKCDSHGTARWPVKTSAISSADNAAQTLGVAAFVNAPDLDITSAPNDSFITQNVTIGGATVREGQLVQVTGFLSDVHCEKNDGDYHGDLRANDSGAGPPCAIVEVPYPGNVSKPETNARVTEVRQAFDQWLDQQTVVHVTLIGQLFYDITHHSSTDPGGGRGSAHCARTLWEIHPVLKVFIVGSPTPQPTISPAASPTTAATAEPTTTPTSTSTGTPAMFDTEGAAQQHCPSDTVVWLNTRSNLYHLKGHRYYGTTAHGAYVCEQEAVRAGYEEGY